MSRKKMGRIIAWSILIMLALPTLLFAETRILFLGDSLTSGYGIPKEAAYPARVSEIAAAKGVAISVVNGGMSGDTSAGALRRVDFYLAKPSDIFVLAIGANDGLRGLDTREMEKNIRATLGKVRSKYPSVKILLAGMEAPPNMGQDYAMQFREAFKRVATEEEVQLLPFLLEGVASDPSLNLSDRMHPNEEGHKVIAEQVWKALQPLVITSK